MKSVVLVIKIMFVQKTNHAELMSWVVSRSTNGFIPTERAVNLLLDLSQNVLG